MKNVYAILLFALFPIALFAVDDVASAIQEYPVYKALEANETISKQFLQYMEWLSDKSPDATFVYQLMQNKANSLDAIAVIFHEKVEFYEWLKLGHRFEDIMTVEYFQKHYPDVYPIVHRRALIEEINLIKYFAQKKGFSNIPEIAYNLVSPIIEKYNVSVARFQKRLKVNLEYQAQMQFLSENDLKIAITVYEAGGYQFKEKDRIFAEAMTLIADSKK